MTGIADGRQGGIALRIAACAAAAASAGRAAQLDAADALRRLARGAPGRRIPAALQRRPFGAACAVAGLLICAAHLAAGLASPETANHPSPARLEDATATEADGWLTIQKPMALFGLDSPDLPSARRAYVARRRSLGPEREDILSFNDFDDERGFLTLRLRRHGAQTEPSSLFVAAARRAAEDGLAIERMAASRDMMSKFGPVETADATIVSPDRMRGCVALRIALAGGAFELSGLACGADGRPADPAHVACLVDRMSLLVAGEDRAMRQIFADAERSRLAGCAAPRIAADTRKGGWPSRESRR